MGGSSAAITYLRPCITEAGKISAETHLAPSSEESANSTLAFYDSARLCWALNSSQIFDRVKCSEKLGIAKLDVNGKTIVVSKNGRINVRRAENEQDALKTTRLASKATWPAMICPTCGKAVLECIAGLCAQCTGRACPLLLRGPPEAAPTSAKPSKTKTVREILKELEASQQSVFNEIKRNLDEAFQTLNCAIVTSSFDDSLVGVKEAVGTKLEVGKSLAQRLIAHSQRQTEASAGLALMAIGANLEGLGHAVCRLRKLVQSHNDSLAATEAWHIATDGYKTLWTRDPVEDRELAKFYTRLKRRLSRSKEKPNDDLRKSLEKVVELGLHLSRIVSIRLAV